MVVVLVGPIRGDIHALARALARALGAAVVDGDRVERDHAADPDASWSVALTRALSGARRSHKVATCRSLSAEQRHALRELGLTTILLRDETSDADHDADHETDREWVWPLDADDEIERVATRLYQALMRGSAREAEPEVEAAGGLGARTLDARS